MRMEAEEAAVVERARQGDREAFRQLVLDHSRNVFRLAFRITGEEASAEDVVQETFLSAYRGLARFDGRSRFGTWIHRIAVNHSVEVLRRRQQITRPLSLPAGFDEGEGELAALEPRSGEPGPDRHAASGQIAAVARRALAALTPMEKTAFALRHFEGRSIAEIGSALGVRESASKQAVFRAVRKLREALQPFVTC